MIRLGNVNAHARAENGQEQPGMILAEKVPGTTKVGDRDHNRLSWLFKSRSVVVSAGVVKGSEGCSRLSVTNVTISGLCLTHYAFLVSQVQAAGGDTCHKL
eukprot:364495-Chlamydomonas_euryale.AAC.7